jgi:hypothetical protein
MEVLSESIGAVNTALFKREKGGELVAVSIGAFIQTLPRQWKCVDSSE